MTDARLPRIARGLAFALIALYVAAGIGLLISDSDEPSLAVFLFGGAGLLIVGRLAAGSSSWLSAVLVSIGALAGGFALVFTIIVPVAAAALIAMSFSIARSKSSPA